MALMLTLVRNEDLHKMLERIDPKHFVAYLVSKGWERREANKVPGINIWEFKNKDVPSKRRFFGGEDYSLSDIISVPAPHCYEKKYADYGRMCWHMVMNLAAVEQRSPLAVLCEVYPSVCDWLEHGDLPCGWSAGS